MLNLTKAACCEAAQQATLRTQQQMHRRPAAPQMELLRNRLLQKVGVQCTWLTRHLMRCSRSSMLEHHSVTCCPATADVAAQSPYSVPAPEDAVEGDAEAGWRHSMTEVPPYVAVVRDRHDAQRVAHLLSTRYRGCTFGADTEVRWRRTACS